LLDRTSYQRFCLLQNSRNVPDRNTIWRFSERIGVDGATALPHGVDAQLHSHGFIARGGQAIDATHQHFTAQRPDQLWVADFTYVSTWQGQLFVGFVIDVYARRIAGWRVSSHVRTDFVVDILE